MPQKTCTFWWYVGHERSQGSGLLRALATTLAAEWRQRWLYVQCRFKGHEPEDQGWVSLDSARETIYCARCGTLLHDHINY
jgi:hypothetical protein